MKTRDIHQNWCTEYTFESLEEIMSIPDDVCRDWLIKRGVLIVRGLPNTLSDLEYNAIANKFGQLWTNDEYHRFAGGHDKTVKKEDDSSTSYYQTANNFSKTNELQYHADMAHVGPKSLPARSLYMVKTAENDTGKTQWLHLEEAYDQFTDEEKAYYEDVSIFQQFMYAPGRYITEFPFLKKNPYTGRLSPRMNCYGKDTNFRGMRWIHHVSKGGQTITDGDEFIDFMENVYKLCESKNETVYKHTWVNGDILIYDNWCSVHMREDVKFKDGEPDRLLKRLTFNIRS